MRSWRSGTRLQSGQQTIGRPLRQGTPHGRCSWPVGVRALTRAPVRWSAAQLLGRLGDVAAVPELVEALGDEDEQVPSRSGAG